MTADESRTQDGMQWSKKTQNKDVFLAQVKRHGLVVSGMALRESRGTSKAISSGYSSPYSEILSNVSQAARADRLGAADALWGEEKTQRRCQRFDVWAQKQKETGFH